MSHFHELGRKCRSCLKWHGREKHASFEARVSLEAGAEALGRVTKRIIYETGKGISGLA